MQISKIVYFGLVLHLILGKVTKVPVEKFSTSEVVRKNLIERRGTPSVLLGSMVAVETVTFTMISSSIFGIYSKIPWLCKVSLPSSGRKKTIANCPMFSLVSHHLNLNRTVQVPSLVFMLLIK